MPFTGIDLAKAIDKRNVDTVIKILRDTNAQGIPKVDINSVIAPNEGISNSTALLYAMAYNRYAFKPLEEANFQIIQAILAVRDNQNNPVIDINRKSGVYSSLEAAISIQYNSTAGNYRFDQQNAEHVQKRLMSRRLVEMFLDLRDARGHQSYDLSRENHERLLMAAIDSNDPQIVIHLLDWRNIAGQRLISVNQVWRVGGVSMTPIEYANQVHGECINNPPSPEIVGVLRELGGRPFQELPRELQPPQNIPLAPQNAQNNINPNNVFERDPQNTHNTAVTISVNSSIKKLRVRYPMSEIKKATALKALLEYINTLPNNPQKASVIECFKRITRDATIRSEVQATLSEVLALVYYGIHDKEALPPHIIGIDDNYLNLRKESLIEKLYEAQNTYGPAIPSCFVGTLNKIVETLNHAHPDVFIVFGNENVLTSATGFSLDFSNRYFLAELRKKTIKEQRKILRTWNDDEEKDKKIDSASHLRASAAILCKNKLTETFGILLTESQRDDITGQFEYLPRPIIHKELSRTIELISAIPNDPGRKYRNPLIGRLKKYAENAYAETDHSFEEEQVFLSEALSGFNQLDKYATSLLNIKGNEDKFQNTFLKKLKNHAEQAYADDKNSIQNKKTNLENEKKDYDKLFSLLSHINQIKERHDDAIYQKRLALLKKDIVATSLNNAMSFKKSYSAINTLLFNFELDNLYDAINKLQAYGQKLKNNSFAQKGQVAEDLAIYLNKEARQFFARQKPITTEDFQKFNQTFVNILNSKNSEMSQYRTQWSTILRNIAIALSGIGLVFIAAKLVSSKIIDGRALFFFQKKKTTCEDQAEAINTSLSEVNLCILNRL